MARKTRKQKIKASTRSVITDRVIAASNTPQNPAPAVQKIVKKEASVVMTMSAEDIAEANVTKKGIVKTLLIIACIALIQAAVFFAKSKGMLPF